MEKTFFAVAAGPKGGVSVSLISGPLKSLDEIAEWATANIGKAKNGKIAVLEVIGHYSPVEPVVKFTPVVHDFIGIKNDEVGELDELSATRSDNFLDSFSK